jgi:hypothetical protein
MTYSRYKISLISLLIAGLSGCGGSSSGSSSGSTVDAEYTGISTPASLSTPAVASSYIVSYRGSSSAVGATQATPSNATSSSASTRTVQNIDDVAYGDCGGSLTVSGTVDDQTEYLDIYTVSNDFCNAGLTANGRLDIKGYLTDMNISLNGFTATSTEINTTVYGSVNYSENSPYITTTITAVVKDNLLNATYKLDNWTEQLNSGVYPNEQTISGKYYIDDMGYVTVSTLEALTLDYYGVADSGKIQLNGKSSTAFVTFYSGSYLVEVDNDNDGSIDDSQVY